MTIRHLAGAMVLLLPALAQAEQVLVAHPGIGIASITPAHVSRLFFGQTDLLPDGSRAVPLNVSGSARDAFAREVLKKSPEQVEKYWARMIFTGRAKPPREVRPAEVKAIVAATPGAISYLDRKQVDASVKVVAVTEQ